jgi:hypothetical protein
MYWCLIRFFKLYTLTNYDTLFSIEDKKMSQLIVVCVDVDDVEKKQETTKTEKDYFNGMLGRNRCID